MSWSNIKALKEQRSKLFNDAQAISDKAVAEKRDLTQEETEQHTKLLAEVESFKPRIEAEERATQIGEQIAVENRSAVIPNVHIGNTEERSTNSLGMPEKDFSKYSLLRGINRRLAGQPLDGVEAEVNKEMEKRNGRPTEGLYFPVESKFKQRTILDATQGAGAIPTIVEPTFIEILRKRVVCVGLGATLMQDMTGNFAIPKQTAAATAYWVADGSAPSGSYQTIGQVNFSPKTCAAYTDISRNFVKQSCFSAEDFVRNDLARVIGIALDTAALKGTGSSNQPLGIIPNLTANYTGQVATAAADSGDGGAPAFGDVIELESLVAEANADFGRLSYVATPAVRGKLKQTPKSADAVAAGFVWDGTEVNGYNAVTTNVLSSALTEGSGSGLSEMLYGNFESLVFALWGGLEILLDPYTGSSSGTLRIVAMQSVDINVRYPQSFAYLPYLITA